MDSHYTQDYTSWSNEALIERVTGLEAQLRAHNLENAKVLASPATSTTPLRKKPKKPRTFDPSKYSDRLIALKFAYLGKYYNGFEHHANNTTPLPTVEEKLWRALRKTRLIFPAFADGQSEDEVCWEGCEYSKCGRTDRGVSAFGQVIGIRVRSSRPKVSTAISSDGDGIVTDAEKDAGGDSSIPDLDASSEGLSTAESEPWDSVKDELPYIQLLNRVLPPTIRVLAWCPQPPSDFSARFSCKERKYRYFFTNPAYCPSPSARPQGDAGVEDKDGGLGDGGAWLDIEAMRTAAKKLEGVHDFRNLCKVDASKQLSEFRRRIFESKIEAVRFSEEAGAFLGRLPFVSHTALTNGTNDTSFRPQMYYFEVRGSAFLWHQVRHLVAILFLVGQRFENPSIVDELLDIKKVPSKPVYEMAADTPLVLWDCVFSEPGNAATSDHGTDLNAGHEDGLDWIYVGDTTNVREVPGRGTTGTEDRKWGRLGVMEDIWALWKQRKMDEFLAGSLMDVVARQGNRQCEIGPDRLRSGEVSARVFDGSELPKTVGNYVPLMQRERLDTPEVVNKRYADRKGLLLRNGVNGEV